MLNVLFAITLLSLLNYGNTVEDTTKCPNGCSCGFANFFTELNIDCSHGLQKEERLLQHLDALLFPNSTTDRLTSLRVINTPLTLVPSSVCHLVNLKLLILDRNRIVQLPDNCFTKLTKLVILSLASNVIHSLQDGLFDGLQELVSLNLASNQISFIGLRVFSNASDLTRLRTLNLNFNKLTSLEPWWYYRCIHGSQGFPVSVMVNHNQISNFTNRLQFYFRCGMKRPVGFLDVSFNRITHVMDIVQGWNISNAINYMCLKNSIGNHPLFRIVMKGYFYACDCVDFLLYAWSKTFQHWQLLTEAYCDRNKFRAGTGGDVLVSTIPLLEFVCDISDGCPPNCRCVYRPANATLHVDCSSSNISSLPLHVPSLPKSYAKYKLDFSSNKHLRRLEHRSYFDNTSILDVSNCSLTEINMEVLKDGSVFEIALDFRGNMLESLPKDAVNVNVSAKLSLGHNPWQCSCDNSWILSWFKSRSHQISDPKDIICSSPARLRGRNILRSTSSDFCDDPVRGILTITLSSASTVIVLLVGMLTAGLLVYKFREKFYKRWKFHPFDRDECVGEELDYDVFFCCSYEDHRAHALRIIDLIESKGYRVCYHERDFLPGSLITDSIGRSIERSKRTVCFISNNFLRSNFCMTEFDMAYHHIVAVKRKKRLVVLMALDNPADLYANDASDTATLRHYLHQYTYIDYTSEDWLDRLLYALPMHGLMQNIEDDPTDDVQLIQDIQLN